MKIEWNKVTWYSWLCTAVVFLGVLPVLALYIQADYNFTQAEITRPMERLLIAPELLKHLHE